MSPLYSLITVPLMSTISLFKTATDKERVRFQLNSFKDREINIRTKPLNNIPS